MGAYKFSSEASAINRLLKHGKALGTELTQSCSFRAIARFLKE